MRYFVFFILFLTSAHAGIFIEPYASTIFTKEGIVLNDSNQDPVVQLDYYENQGLMYGGKLGVEWGWLSFGVDYSYSEKMKRQTSTVGQSVQNSKVFKASFLGYFAEIDFFDWLVLGTKYYDKVKLVGDQEEALFGAFGFYGALYFKNDLGISLELRKLKSKKTIDKNEMVLSVSIPFGRFTQTTQEVEE